MFHQKLKTKGNIQIQLPVRWDGRIFFLFKVLFTSLSRIQNSVHHHKYIKSLKFFEKLIIDLGSLWNFRNNKILWKIELNFLEETVIYEFIFLGEMIVKFIFLTKNRKWNNSTVKWWENEILLGIYEKN